MGQTQSSGKKEAWTESPEAEQLGFGGGATLDWASDRMVDPYDGDDSDVRQPACGSEN